MRTRQSRREASKKKKWEEEIDEDEQANIGIFI